MRSYQQPRPIHRHKLYSVPKATISTKTALYRLSSGSTRSPAMVRICLPPAQRGLGLGRLSTATLSTSRAARSVAILSMAAQMSCAYSTLDSPAYGRCRSVSQLEDQGALLSLRRFIPQRVTVTKNRYARDRLSRPYFFVVNRKSTDADAASSGQYSFELIRDCWESEPAFPVREAFR